MTTIQIFLLGAVGGPVALIAAIAIIQGIARYRLHRRQLRWDRERNGPITPV